MPPSGFEITVAQKLPEVFLARFYVKYSNNNTSTICLCNRKFTIPYVAFISCYIDYVFASMAPNVFVFNVIPIPHSDLCDRQLSLINMSLPVTEPVTVSPIDRGLSLTVKQEKGRGASYMNTKCFPYESPERLWGN